MGVYGARPVYINAVVLLWIAHVMTNECLTEAVMESWTVWQISTCLIWKESLQLDTFSVPDEMLHSAF